MSIPGSTPVTGFIAPTDVLDTFATHDSDYSRGDKHVSNIFTRDSISEDRRKWGMLCHVYDDGASTGTYQLVFGLVDTDITNNSNWQLFSGGGSGGGIFETDSVDLDALAASSVGDKATAFTLSGNPIANSYIIVDVNGKNEIVGNGAKDKGFYFSGDAGVTARTFATVQAGDELYLGSNLGYSLDITDKISIYQLV